MDVFYQVFMLLVLAHISKAAFYQNYEKKLAVEFYKDLISTEQQRAYNYTKRTDNSEFFEGNGDTTQSIGKAKIQEFLKMLVVNNINCGAHL